MSTALVEEKSTSYLDGSTSVVVEKSSSYLDASTTVVVDKSNEASTTVVVEPYLDASTKAAAAAADKDTASMAISSKEDDLSLPVPSPIHPKPRKKKLRRRRLSEILRLDGLKIPDATQGTQQLTKIWSMRRSDQNVSVLSRRYSLVRDTRGSRSSVAHSEGSIISLLPAPRESRRPTILSKVSPKVRFRQAIHKVMMHQFWAKKYQGIAQHQKTTYLGPGDKDGEREFLTFNAKFFRSDVQYQSLSVKAKTILSRPTWLRTEEELHYIYRYTIRLHCFSRYNAFVRKELAKVLYYEKVERDHYVIRQGSFGWFFYFIVSGTCLVEMKDVCLRSGKMVSLIAGEVKAGGSFGELALMQNTVRRASIFTTEDCEFLKVDKPSFDEVLKKSHEAEWKHRLMHLSRHPLFLQWRDANLTTAVEGSQTKEYMPGSVILRNLSTPCENIHFIIQGCCQVVQRVKVWEKMQHYDDESFMFQPCGPMQDTPHSSAAPHSRRSSMSKNCRLMGTRVYRLVNKWWVIRTLKEGEYFGLGEGEEGMSVVCNQKVVILHMSKTVFRKHDRARDLAFLRSEAISWYPSKEGALKSYLDWKRWLQYRRNVVLEVMGCRRGKESTENCILADEFN